MAPNGKTVAGEHTFRGGIDRSYPDAIDRNAEIVPDASTVEPLCMFGAVS